MVVGSIALLVVLVGAVVLTTAGGNYLGKGHVQVVWLISPLQESRLPRAGEWTVLPSGGSAYWGVGSLAPSILSGTGVESGNSGSPAPLIAVYNLSAMACFLEGNNSCAQPKFIAHLPGNVSDPENGSFEFDFHLLPGDWDLVLTILATPGPCSGSCPPATQLTMIQWYGAGIQFWTWTP